MKNKELILKVKAYLEQKPEERDLEAGALMVLQLTNNRIMYNNFMRRPKHYASRIEYELQKKYNFFVQELTHAEVADMQRQVAAIVTNHRLDKEELKNAEAGTSIAPSEAGVSATGANSGTTNEEFKKGKRSDHDALPEEIQALYATNLSIMQRMRMLHTKLQLLSVENSTCPDSERYPFLKELIELDKQYHENWHTYDHFVLSGAPAPVAPATEEKNDEEAASPSAQDSADKSAETRPASEPAMNEGTAEPAQADEQQDATPAASDQPSAIPAEPKKKTTRKTSTKKAKA